jgi:glycosidase
MNVCMRPLTILAALASLLAMTFAINAQTPAPDGTSRMADAPAVSARPMQPAASPPWVRDAVIYECFVRDFSPEGTFRAVERRLPELRALGVTVLWLMPIHPIGELHRKGSLGSPYSVRDFEAVNPDFGSLADFRSLVDAVHREGMRIIIDLVANHSAWDNPLMTEHPDWYTRDASGAAVPPVPDWSDVADLDYSKPALRAWMIGMMLHWVRDLGIDGFRCDVAEMVPHDFWVEACAALRAVKPVLMLAEGAEPDLHDGAFDLTYAWNTYDVLPRLIAGRASARDLGDELRRERLRYPADALHLRFTTNHDKNCYDAPAVRRYGVDGARAMAVLLHTLPGVPLIYNGQEVGTTKKLCLFEKEAIDWSRDRHGFRRLYTELNALRREYAALREGALTVHDTKQYRSLFAFTRESAEETILVVVNLTKKGAEVTLDEPALAGFERLTGNCAYSTDRDRLGMKVPGFGYFIGVKRK